MLNNLQNIILSTIISSNNNLTERHYFKLHVSSIDDHRKAKYVHIYIFRACDPLEIVRPQGPSRRFHFVQWFVITATNMIHVGSSSHSKRQANYEFETKAEGKTLCGASCRRVQQAPGALRSYTAPQVNHLNLPLALTVSRLRIFRTDSSILPATVPTDRYCLCWFDAASLGYAAAALDTRSPRAPHTRFLYMDHLLRSQSRFRKSQSSAKKSITGSRTPRCRVY